MEWDFHFLDASINEHVMDELLIKASLCWGYDACHCKTLLVLFYSLKMHETAREMQRARGGLIRMPLCPRRSPLILLYN